MPEHVSPLPLPSSIVRLSKRTRSDEIREERSVSSTRNHYPRSMFGFALCILYHRIERSGWFKWNSCTRRSWSSTWSVNKVFLLLLLLLLDEGGDPPPPPPPMLLLSFHAELNSHAAINSYSPLWCCNPRIIRVVSIVAVIWADERIADCSGTGCRHGNVYRARLDTCTSPPEYCLPGNEIDVQLHVARGSPLLVRQFRSSYFIVNAGGA